MGTKTILVTGGAGFIGTNLVHELQLRGHEVIACDLYNTDRENYIRTDVRSYRQLERIFEKSTFDYVYHLAANRLLFSVSMAILIHLVRIIKIKGPKRDNT